MSLRKKGLAQFFIWMRNGIAFCTCWLMILWIIFNTYYGIENITTESVAKLFGLVTGGVFLFCLFFSRLCIRRWKFIYRLSCFIFTVSIYECYGFYEMGIFIRTGSLAEWMIFVGIVLILYLCCLVIYRQYSRKKGELYTKALQDYQKKRRKEQDE